LAGFNKTTKTGLVLDPAAKLNVDLNLAVGAVTESIEVSGSAIQVETESAQVGRALSQRNRFRI
jgi:hypothetical protein